jgi:phospholipid/cholesterol/gamma-HCH transport system permease protein
MSSASEPSLASVSVEASGPDLTVAASGHWQLTGPVPPWARQVGATAPARVRLRMDGVASWDSSLLLYFSEVAAWCRTHGAACDATALPERMRTLLAQLEQSRAAGTPRDRRENFLASVGLATREVWAISRSILDFVGECVLGLLNLAGRPRKFRWRDWLDQIQQCGAMALPIVSLISVLVGLTLAYQAAVELRQFGADIYVADLVGLSIVREMGPMMAAIILAGRTGAAFAATLGNMQANEEIDAFRVLGISPVQFLVLPRLLALAVMMPLLALYADAIGAAGGMLVAAGTLHIPPVAYWNEMRSTVDLHDIGSGLIKSLVFGVLIGVAGCMCGLRADRSAAGVGRAATSAVVTAIFLIVVADALFAVVFNLFNI